MWDSLSQRRFIGGTDKFTEEEEVKQRKTECWDEISLVEVVGLLWRRRRTNR
jgi:hypothetical protein